MFLHVAVVAGRSSSTRLLVYSRVYLACAASVRLRFQDPRPSIIQFYRAYFSAIGLEVTRFLDRHLFPLQRLAGPAICTISIGVVGLGVGLGVPGDLQLFDRDQS